MAEAIRVMPLKRAGVIACLICAQTALAAEAGRAPGDPQRGYQLLVSRAYLPPDFDQEVLDRVWEVWPDSLRNQAAAADPAERRKLIWDRYGLTPRPDDPSRPLQYVVDDQGNWTMNCFACHAGRVAGEVVPGLPNSNYALELLTIETRRLKWRLGKPLSRMDLGMLIMPLGRTRGTTNAVMFGVALMAYRDAELNVDPDRHPGHLVHHDMDAPPWWNLALKQRLYIDGSVKKGVRPLMQFMLVKENGPEAFARWEEDYRHILAYLESLTPPDFPGRVDRALARQGQAVFEAHCAECHGTYGPQGEYPETPVPIGVVGTDPVRLEALTAEHRRRYNQSWFTHFGRRAVSQQPTGYVAPPLRGIWATAPYLHNGSVPTLWHLLHPDERPVVWKRQGRPGYDYDFQRVGLPVVRLDPDRDQPGAPTDLHEIFDTRDFGKSAAGHDFPAQLSPAQRRAVLEYLKTL